MTRLRALRDDTVAVTALEYDLIAALIAAVLVGAVTSVGTNIASTFMSLATTL